MGVISMTSFASTSSVPPRSSGVSDASRRKRSEMVRRLNLALALAVAVPLGTLIGWISGVGSRRDRTPTAG